MENTRKQHLDFLHFAMSISAMSASALAKKSQLSSTTITRFLTNQNQNELSINSLNKISKTIGYNSYQDFIIKNGERLKENLVQSKSYIDDSLKFEIYDRTKKLLEKKIKIVKPEIIADISQKVIEAMIKLDTKIFTDSLIMYIIDTDNFSNIKTKKP